MNKEMSLRINVSILGIIGTMSIILATMAYCNLANDYLNRMSADNGVVILSIIILICVGGMIYYENKRLNLIGDEKK